LTSARACSRGGGPMPTPALPLSSRVRYPEGSRIARSRPANSKPHPGRASKAPAGAPATPGR
jgi:hypothetical protein